MKRLSLKTRLVLLHTALMTLVVSLVLGVLFSVSSQEILANVENALETQVTQAMEDVEFRHALWLSLRSSTVCPGLLLHGSLQED